MNEADSLDGNPERGELDKSFFWCEAGFRDELGDSDVLLE